MIVLRNRREKECQIWELAWKAEFLNGVGVNRLIDVNVLVASRNAWPTATAIGQWAAHRLGCARNISLSFSPYLSSSSHSTPLASLSILLGKMSTGFGAEIVATFDKLQDVSLPSAQAPHG